MFIILRIKILEVFGNFCKRLRKLFSDKIIKRVKVLLLINIYYLLLCVDMLLIDNFFVVK